ncbi:MAG: YihY/virulence factor BrkB family protein [Crocinitomicaceae bacterium]|nr:YihY/virulence factor BrkB family protein [Crocinitomicaceae bacterium]
MSISRKNLIASTIKEFISERSFMHGAALAYYAVFALVPILYLSVAVFGRVVGHNTMVDIITNFLTEQIGLGDVTGILDFLNQVDLGGGNIFMEIIGMIALMFSSTALINSLRRSMNDFYDLDKLTGSRKKLIVRGALFRLVSMLFITGTTVLLVIFYFAETIFLSVGNDLLENYSFLNTVFTYLAQHGIPLLANGIIFTFVFKYLHDGKVVWRRAIQGAIVTSILLYLGQLVIQYYLKNYFFAANGGVIGTVLIILVWVYYSSQIIFLGAKYVAVKSRLNGEPITLRD